MDATLEAAVIAGWSAAAVEALRATHELLIEHEAGALDGEALSERMRALRVLVERERSHTLHAYVRAIGDGGIATEPRRAQ